MKIIYDNDIFAIQKFGGISRYYVELLAHLTKGQFSNVQPQILNGLHRNSYLKHLKIHLKSKPMYLPNFKGAGYILTKFNKYFIDLFSDFNADIYHATYYRLPERLSPSVIKVITVYDMIHELYPSYFSANDQTIRLKAKAINDADHILAISQNTKQDLIDIYQVPESKITVTYLGVDHLNEKKQGQKKREKFILYVGPRGGYKNFNRLLEAFSNILKTNLNLNLIAFGGGGFNEKENSLMNSLGIPSECVQQISGSDEVLLDLYARALVFVYPSIYEGFGIPPFEAMARGCPVVASKTSSIGEVLGNGALLCNPHDVSDMSNKIDTMINNRDCRMGFIDQGHEQVKKYTWAKTTELTLQTYSRLLN